MSHRQAVTVARDAHPIATACRCAMRTRPKVSSGLPVRKYGLCNLIDATSARAEPTSSQTTALAAKNSTGPRQEASIVARSAADRSRSDRDIARAISVRLRAVVLHGRCILRCYLAGEGVG